MAVKKSSGVLASLGPVDWHRPLADYYAKHGQDLERNLADASTQRNRAATIADDESFIKQFKAAGNAFTQVVMAKKAIDQKLETGKEKDIQKIKKELENLPFFIQNKDDLNAKAELEYKHDKKVLLDKENEFGAKYDEILTRLQNSADGKPAAVALLNASGRRLIAMNEMLGHDAIAGLNPKTITAGQKWFKENPKWATLWDASDEGSDGRDAVFKQYQLDKIAHLRLNDTTIAAVLGKELSRQSKTARGMGLAKSVSAITSEEDRKIGLQLTTANRTGNLESAIWTVRDDLINSKDPRFAADAFQTRNQKVDEFLYETLNDLAIDGFINESQLQPYIDSGFETPAGKGGVGTPGELFWTKEKINGLVRSARAGSGRHVAVQMGLAEQQLRALKLAALRGEDVTAQLQDIENKFPELKEKIEDVRNTNVKDNTPDAYADEKKEWRGRLNSGNLIDHKELAKTIKNKDLKKEVLARIAHHKERRTELGYPEDDEKFIRDRIAKAFDLTLKEDEKLTGKLYELQVHLVQKFRREFQNQIEGPNGEPITDPNSFILTNDAFETYIVKNGINGGRVKDSPVGIFTATSQGRLDNFRVFQDQRLDAIREHQSSAKLAESQSLRTKYNKEVYDALDLAHKAPEDGQPLKERVLDISESVLSRNDILGFFSTKKLAPEIIYKARKLGIPPSTLIRRQLEALVKADSDYAKLHQLDKIEFPEGGDEQIYGMLERANSDLRFLFTRTDLSPNQNQRMIELWDRALDKQEYLGKPAQGTEYI